MSDITTENPSISEVQSDNPICSVTSQPKPQSGQKHRSSGNFSTQDAPTGTQQIQWFVTENENFDSISFDVEEDIKFWEDKVIFKDVKNGEITKYVSNRQLYISNPKNAGGETFIVQAWPYPNDSDLVDR